MIAAVPSRTNAATAPKAYVALFNDNAVAVIDTGTKRVRSTIAIPVGPDGMAISPDGTRVYVASAGTSTVSVICTVTDRVVSTIEVGTAPNGLAITRDGRRLLVAVWGANQVAIVDTARNQVIGRIPVGNPHTVALSPDGQTAYVTSQQPGATAIVVLNLATRSVAATVPVTQTPRDLNVSPDGALAYYTLAGVNAVQVLDTTRSQVVAQIPVGASPHIPLIAANGEYGVVVVQGPGQLTVINPSTQQVVGTVPVGKFPHWVAITSDGDTAYVTNEGANTVSVVDIEKQRVLATIPVGNAPRKVVVQPAGAAGLDAAPAGPAVASMTSPATPRAAVGAGGGVVIANFAFAPATLRVARGATLTWTNTDSVPHTVTAADRRWDSGDIQPGGSFSATVDAPGTYRYACAIHPFMQAVIVVGEGDR